MKKIIFLMLVFLTSVTFSFANDKAVSPVTRVTTVHQSTTFKSFLLKLHVAIVKSDYGRECCEKAGMDDHGNIITVEACAGWFLSNSDNAHARACDKANAALREIIGDNF